MFWYHSLNILIRLLRSKKDRRNICYFRSQLVENDQVYSNTWVSTHVNTISTQVNTNQRESNTSQHKSTRLQHKPTQINTSQRESNTSQQELTRVRQKSTRINKSLKQVNYFCKKSPSYVWLGSKYTSEKDSAKMFLAKKLHKMPERYLQRKNINLIFLVKVK